MATDPVTGSKDWKAWEHRKTPEPSTFHVSGIVVVRATNYAAYLRKAAPQGINPKILLLNLLVSSSGPVGGDAITDLPVSYQEVDYEPGRYEQVTVLRSEGGGVHIDKVEIVRAP